jgi:hypothetical protein
MIIVKGFVMLFVSISVGQRAACDTMRKDIAWRHTLQNRCLHNSSHSETNKNRSGFVQPACYNAVPTLTKRHAKPPKIPS